MRKLGYNIIHLIQLIRFFGAADGFKIFCKIIFTAKHATIGFNCRHFKNSVSIRKENSDIEIFYQVFCELQYDMLYYLDFKPENIIDCGSNVGYSCLYFANKFPDATIAAVEPEAKNFRQLEYNTRNYTNVNRYHAAIWHQATAVSIKDEKEWSASFEVEEKRVQNEQTLPGMTIDQIARENNIVLIQSPMSMFRASGILYSAGLNPVY